MPKKSSDNGVVLSKPQKRILDAMKSGRAMTRQTISDNANVDISWLSKWIGRLNPVTRKQSEERFGYTSLLTHKFISVAKEDVGGRDTVVFKITPAGKKSAK